MCKFIDMTGWVMSEHGIPDSQLTVIEKAEPYISKSGVKSVQWKCKCSCGNETIVRGTFLRNGRTKSCGCLQKNISRKNFSVDLTNQKFGMLTALYQQPSIVKNRGVLWHCKCDCGNECDVLRVCLTTHQTYSCGCLRQSHKEFDIEQILIKHNIPYEKEKTFNSCRFKDTNYTARFDFYIDNKYLIEYDGAQHFKSVEKWWGGKEGYLKRVQHDQEKTLWCKENNIPLIRLNYIDNPQINLEDILLETTKYRVV